MRSAYRVAWLEPKQLLLRRQGGPPYSELLPGALIVYALKWQVIGALGLACHTVLVKEFGPASMIFGVAGLAWLAFQSALPAFIVFLQILLLQNVVTSVFSPGMSHGSYVVLSGSSFVSAVVVAAAFAYGIFGSGDAQSKRLCKFAIAAIAAAAAYMVLGAATAGPVAAIISFRSVTAMLFSVFIGLRIGQLWGFRTVATCFVLAVCLSLIPATLEIADPAWYLNLINAKDFFNLKNEGLRAEGYAADVQSVIENQTSLWFNSALLGGSGSFRFGGTNMHSISYAYVLAVAELLLLSLRRYELLLILLVFSFNIGVKGPTVVLIISTLLYLFWRVTGHKRLLVAATVAFCAVYIVSGIRTGVEIGDYHALGFMGGVNGFLSNPLGHGLGAGGNLTMATSTAFWQKVQHAGAADVGLESAVGVMLYQMGIGCLPVFAALLALIRAAPFGAAFGRGAVSTDFMFIGLAICIANGVFQEEAYSPYATGLLVLFCSVLVANGRRRQVIVEEMPS